MGEANDLVPHLLLSLPQRPVCLVATAHPTLEQLGSISGWCAPCSQGCCVPDSDPYRTGRLVGKGRADTPSPMARPLFQLLDRGQNPSTRSPGGHGEPIMFFTSLQT